tara:strand:+ start:1642 stop:1842 length:201 start_codon:yes stop_codon:yes gene_type:complete
MSIDDTKWFTSRPNLGVDYVLVVDCGAGGVFKCETVELANEAIRNASRNACGYMLRSEDIITKEKN